jgi:hypothetical protein
MHSPRKILVVCPLCEKRGEIQVPEEVLIEKKGSSVILVRSGITCTHSYQVFVDKNCTVRGYQRTDYEVPVAQQSGNASIAFTASGSRPLSKTSTTPIPPTNLDHQITAAIQDFLAKIDTFISPSTCSKGIAELQDFIQSRQGFHPVLPDMKNWANNLRIGAMWDVKAKERVRKRVLVWLEKTSSKS